MVIVIMMKMLGKLGVEALMVAVVVGVKFIAV